MKNDPFTLLSDEHRRLTALFDALEAAGGHRRETLFGELRTALNLHAESEEGALYPLLENNEETCYLAIQAYDEHDMVKALLAELGKEPVGSKAWLARLRVMREIVDNHMTEEEEELLPEARQLLSQEQICQLWDDLAHVWTRYYPHVARGRHR